MKLHGTWMRGGTSKGLFLRLADLPADAARRDAILLRAMGSPDRYGTQIDGLGGATPSTSKVVLVSRSSRTDCDIDYLFGAVSVQKREIDWSGNCGNLTAAVGPYALSQGLIDPADGPARVRLWQANISQKIIAHFPVQAGEPIEVGEFELDGVPFPSAEVKLEFLDPGSDPESGSGPMFPTSEVFDRWDAPGFPACKVTLIVAGAPTLFVSAASLGLTGIESHAELAADGPAREALISLRRRAAVQLGLAPTEAEADALSPHVPRVAFVAPARSYQAAGGKSVIASDIDLCARILTLGKLHHAMTGTGAVALAVAAAVPGTVVAQAFGSGARHSVRFGHPSGMLQVGASVEQAPDGRWTATKVEMSRSARRLMDGDVFVPGFS